MKLSKYIAIVGSVALAGPVALSHNIQCPLGFNLQGKKCERILFKPPMKVCPVGQLLGDQCLITAPLISQCPFGTEEHENYCLIKSVGPVLAQCAPGYNLINNQCSRKIMLDLIDTCEVGKPDGNGNCIIEERVTLAKKQICPSEFYPEGDGCVKITEYDCSPDPPPLMVPKKIVQTVTKSMPTMPFLHNSYNFGHHKRLLGSKKNSYVPMRVPPVQTHTKQPVVVETKAPPVLPSNVAVIKQLCRRQDFANPIEELFCPSGYVNKGAYCVNINVFPMVRRCVNGAPIDSCHTDEIVPPISMCENGEYMNGSCVVIHKLEKELVCPPGTMQEKGNCVSHIPPHLTCPAGTILEGMQCVGKEIAEPQGTIETPCVGKGCFTAY